MEHGLRTAARQTGSCHSSAAARQQRTSGQTRATYPCLGALAISHRLPRLGATATQGFVVAWHFPNAYADLLQKQKQQGVVAASERRREGHLYAERFSDLAAVTAHLVAQRGDLEQRTRAFRAAFFDSTLPPAVLDQVVDLAIAEAQGWMRQLAAIHKLKNQGL